MKEFAKLVGAVVLGSIIAGYALGWVRGLMAKKPAAAAPAA